MHISLFSILMTILWSTLLIALFLMLRKKVSLLHVCSIQAIILLYLFCAVRLAIPIETAVDKGSIRWQILSVVVLDSGLSHRSLPSL